MTDGLTTVRRVPRLRVDRSMAVWRDQILGPVVAVSIAADCHEEAATVNACAPPGVSIFTSRSERAHEIADVLETPRVAVNIPTGRSDTPLDGWSAAARFFTQTKSVSIRSTRGR